MERVINPNFQLHSAPLVQAVQERRMDALFQRIKDQKDLFGERFPLGPMPVGLRWTTHPVYGFPRTPFRIYRKPRSLKEALPTAGMPVTLQNQTQYFPLAGIPLYYIAVQVSLSAGQSLSMTPRSSSLQDMLHKRQVATASGLHIFRAPFMAGITLAGSGTITNILLIPMVSMTNSPDWEHVQTVGLPIEHHDPNVYSQEKQGYLPEPMRSPKDAAALRLLIGQILHTSLPNLGDPSVPQPTWVAPEHDAYLHWLLTDPGSMLRHVVKCLESCNDFSPSPTDRQENFTVQETVAGIHQSGVPATSSSNVNIPVVRSTLLAASTDCFAALAFGYGTTDFPPSLAGIKTNLESTGTFIKGFASDQPSVMNGFDYMVEANYAINPMEFGFDPFWQELSQQVAYVALDDEAPEPVSPSGLEAMPFRRDRPVSLDGPAHDDIKLRFNPPATRQGFGIVTSKGPGHSQVLNTKFPVTADAYQTWITSVIDNPQNLPEPADAGKYLFILQDIEVPFTGSHTHKYFICGRDVFGRWSPFASRNLAISAMPSQVPSIIDARLIPPATPPDATVPVFPCTLEVEIGWDWADRRPAEIWLRGQFFPAHTQPWAASIPAGWNEPYSPPGLVPPALFERVGAAAIDLRITFTGDTPSVSHGTIQVMSMPADTPSRLRKYLLTLPNFQVNFPTGHPWRVGYVLYAKGREVVRPDHSAFSLPGPVYLDDPRPPVVENLPAEVQYTALPDATRTARGVLTWAPGAGALSYNLWEANETAVVETLKPYLAARFPGQPLKQPLDNSHPFVDRATRLRDLLADEPTMTTCLKLFSRLNKEPINGLKYEMTLPGESDTLFLYRISALSSGGIESGKSSIAFMAVPRLMKPDQPRLQLGVRKAAAGVPLAIRVDALAAEGIPVDGFELYRVRKAPYSNDPGAKGLPFALADHAGWTPVTLETLGVSYGGKRFFDTTVSPSWRPWYYQVVAIGQANAAFGQRKGESVGSTTEMVVIPPEGNPVLVETARESNKWARRAVFSTNLPFFETLEGDALIEVFQVEVVDGKARRTLLLSSKAADVPLSNTGISLPLTLAGAGAFPLMRRLATSASEITTLHVGVPATVTQWSVRVTDPLGRITETLIQPA